MGLELVVRNFHKDSLRCQSDWGHPCNSPEGPVCHSQACLDADEHDPREDRDVLALLDLLAFSYETASWEVHIGSVQNLIHLDSRPVTQTDIPFFQA